ncbi:MAG: hypothetical protein AAGB31_12265, partial [Bdellovibrio sp.]
LFRHVIHDILRYDSMFLAPGQVAVEEQVAADKMKLALEQFFKLAQEFHFELLIVFHPLESEITLLLGFLT